MNKVQRFVLLVLMVFGATGSSFSQNQYEFEYKNYVGILPSFLMEPYDTIDALEVNVFPVVFEHKFDNNLGIQLRPMMNYRFYKADPGLSQVGGTVILNKYFNNCVKDSSWVIPVGGVYNSTTYNLLDKITTLTFGFEAGVLMVMSERITMSITLQPGINYYPDDFSQQFVDADKNGFKSHFGVMFHAGYNF